jgi:flagellar L-ring protein precursor FlgH
MMRRILALTALLALIPLAAPADNLYQAAPPPAGPGHPLRLGPDHRAAQIGDLLYVQFDFNDSNSHTNNYSSQKQFSVGPNATAGIGTNPGFLVNLAANDASSTSTQQSATGADSFVSTMMTTVTDVLPSGALAIAGDQAVVINGRKQTLHITGLVRPEDISSADAVLASRVANVQAEFTGDNQKNKGLLARILSWLF